MTALLEPIGYANWALHALIWLPVLGMGLVLWAEEERAKSLAFWWSIGVFVLSLGLWWTFDPGYGGMQMETATPWIEAWGVSYALGVDGIISDYPDRVRAACARRGIALPPPVATPA